MTKKIATLFFVFCGGFFLTACDPLHKSKCEWYLIPEPEHKDLVQPGWVSLCARNYTINRQKCYLQAKLSYSEALYGQAFRYNDMKIDDNTFPRKVLEVKTCIPETSNIQK